MIEPDNLCYSVRTKLYRTKKLQTSFTRSTQNIIFFVGKKENYTVIVFVQLQKDLQIKAFILFLQIIIIIKFSYFFWRENMKEN